MKHSDRSSLPRLRKFSATASSTVFGAPESTHSWGRRWQVWYEGKRPGKSAHGGPVHNVRNMPFNTARSSIRGRPRLSARSTAGSNGSMRFHCSSVNLE